MKALGAIALSLLLATALSHSVNAQSVGSPLLQKGCEQLSRGNYSLAISTLTQAVRSNPSDLNARRYLCAALLRNGMAKAASQQMEVLVKFAPGNASDLGLLADCYMQCGETQLALERYKQAYTADSSNWNVKHGLAKALVATGDKKAARIVIVDILRTNPDARMRSECMQMLEALKDRSIADNVVGNS